MHFLFLLSLVRNFRCEVGVDSGAADIDVLGTSMSEAISGTVDSHEDNVSGNASCASAAAVQLDQPSLVRSGAADLQWFDQLE
jgi:hypothetical protein